MALKLLVAQVLQSSMEVFEVWVEMVLVVEAPAQ